jgi:uncharacterized membrane protein
MVVILAALILGIFGIVRLGRSLEPRQRVVLVVAFISVVAYFLLKLVQLGYLGQHAADLER